MKKITEEQEEKLLKALSQGSDLATSVAVSAINLDELLAFLEKAENGKRTKEAKEAEELLLKIKQARAVPIYSAQKTIKAFFAEDWKAAAWYLERTLPEIYGKNRGE